MNPDFLHQEQNNTPREEFFKYLDLNSLSLAGKVVASEVSDLLSSAELSTRPPLATEEERLNLNLKKN